MDYTLEELPKPSPKSVVALKFNPEKAHLDMVKDVFSSVSEKFPDNAIITLPDPISLEFMSKETLKKWYDMLSDFLDCLED